MFDHVQRDASRQLLQRKPDVGDAEPLKMLPNERLGHRLHLLVECRRVRRLVEVENFRELFAAGQRGLQVAGAQRRCVEFLQLNPGPADLLAYVRDGRQSDPFFRLGEEFSGPGPRQSAGGQLRGQGFGVAACYQRGDDGIDRGFIPSCAFAAFSAWRLFRRCPRRCRSCSGRAGAAGCSGRRTGRATAGLRLCALPDCS